MPRARSDPLKEWKKERRYYSGVDVSRPTTSCSALALVLLSALTLSGQTRAPSTLRLMPVQPAWSMSLDKVVAASPVFVGQRGFFALDGGEIVAYDMADGTPEWTAQGAPTFTPTTGDGLVFLVEPEVLTALDQKTGAVRWRRPFSEPLDRPLVWDNGWLIGATVSGTIVALRATDGELIWRRDLGSRVHGLPALAADRVYVPVDDGRVVALQVESGEPIWERRLGDKPNDMLALDDRVYVGSVDNFLYCLEADDGEVAWRWRTGADVIGAPVADDRRVYFVSLDNVLRALDLRSGSQRWKRALPNRPTRGVVKAGDLLLVSGVAARVSAFAMSDGAPVGDIPAGGELAAAPYVTEVRSLPQVIVVSRDIARGTQVAALRRNVEPTLGTTLPTLPNPIVVPKPDALAAGTSPAATPGGAATPAPGAPPASEAPPPPGTAPSAPPAPGTSPSPAPPPAPGTAAAR
jgi:hypothetical protein